MFKSLGTGSSNRKLASQLESLVFSRELTSTADVTFNTTPYPNGGDIIGYDGEIACMTYDPIQSLLAIATKSGRITLYADFGRISRLTWTIKPPLAINHLVFKPGTSYLLAFGRCLDMLLMDDYSQLKTSCLATADAKETLHFFDYADLDERGEPQRLLSHSMRSRVKWANIQ